MRVSDTFPPISREALSAFRDASPKMIREVVARALTHTDEVAQHGGEAERLLTSGMEFTTRMLDAVMETGQLPLLEDQLSWAMDRLPHDGVAPQHVLHRLQMYSEVIQELLPAEQAAEVNSFVNWMVARMQTLMRR